MNKPSSSSWEPAGNWYNQSVGQEGHYYHQKIVLPKTLTLLKLDKTSSLLDLGAGQGVLARAIPKEVGYMGVEISPTLLKAAKKLDSAQNHQYVLADATKELKLDHAPFSHGAIILAIQNMADPSAVFRNMARHLSPKGTCVLVINHPCFRIPRQSSWGVDESKKLQYRRLDRYLTPLQVPIQTHPSDPTSSQTLSFHYSLSDLSEMLHQAGFVIEKIEEWCSDKVSTGSAAKMENRAREEFPLFMAIKVLKAFS